jgi:hypothetical protein
VTPLSKRRISVYLAALFLAGGGTGAVISWRLCRSTPAAPLPPAEIGARLRTRWQARLGLTPAQVEHIDPMIHKAMDRVEAIRRQTAKEVFANVSNLDEQVLQVLTPEQKVKFEALERERRDYLQQKFGTGAGAP